MRTIKTAEINHLNRLLAWCEYEVGQEPEQYLEMVKSIIPVCLTDDNHDKVRDIVTEDYNRLKSKPLYVRAAIKALKKYLKDVKSGDTVNGDFEENEVKRLEELK